MDPAASPVILYDGVCGLCNRLNVFVLKRDPHNRFRFASLQSAAAHSVLRRHSKDPSDLNTLYLVLDYNEPGEYLLEKSSAVIAILTELGGFWKSLAWFMKLVPRPLRDLVYGGIARTRYRIFGRYDVCAVPRKEWLSRFIEF
jgi:predicted DCC family thiol-disulfide oxidoreductase YuxK